MAGRIQSELWEVALDQSGFVTAADVRRLGIAVVELGKLSARHQLEKVGHGIYRFPQLPPTDFSPFMLATLWANGRGILSHDTALDLHELCDINPDRIHITIPGDDRYRPRRSGGEFYVVHKETIDPAQVTKLEGAPIVRPFTAIEQGIRSGIRSGLLGQAIENAAGRGAISGQERTALTEALEARR